MYKSSSSEPTKIAPLNTPMEIDDSDGLSVLNSDSLPALDSEESNKIRALLTAENDVAHDRAWYELPHEHRLKLHGVNYALCEPYRQKTRSNTLGFGSRA